MSDKSPSPTQSQAPRRWTESQQQAISTTDAALLVSAAAGSGKTSVLAQRCVYLVCDAPNPCNVSDLLVVTFTRAAAAEMRSRIEKSLQDRLTGLPAASPLRNRLILQLRLIGHAPISTMDGFCGRLIRQHFQRLDLDPGFRTLDENESMLMRNEVADQLMLDQFEAASEPFLQLVQAYGGGQDQAIIGQILRIDMLANTMADRERWYAQARRNITVAARDLSMHSPIAQEFIQDIADQINALQSRIAAAQQIVLPLVGKYSSYLDLLMDTARRWSQACISSEYDQLCRITAQTDFPNLPQIRGEIQGKELAKKQMDALKKSFKDIQEQLRFTAEDWNHSMELVSPHALLLLDLAEEFSHRYAKSKQSLGSLDFSDLERLALKLLKAPVDEQAHEFADAVNAEDPHAEPALIPSDIARACHKRYRHVLVDEYQDNNALQDAIIRLVSTECIARAADQPANLFCVGDVKQSIYGFRLADPDRFLQREKRYRADGENSRVVDLRENFRSRGPLLLAINAAFERLMTRQTSRMEYDQTHALVPGLEMPRPEAACFSGSPIELHLLPRPSGLKTMPTEAASPGNTEYSAEDSDLTNDDQEALLLVHMIRQMMGKADQPARQIIDGGVRALRYKDIAILLRSMGHHAKAFADVLRRNGIPVYNEAGAGFFESMEIRDILNLLKLMDNARQDLPLASFLRSPLCRLADPEDLMLRIRLGADEYSASQDQDPMPFHLAVGWYARQQDDELALALRQVLSQLDQWRDMASRRPIAEVLWNLFQETGYLAFCAGLRDGQQRVANLLSLHQRAQQFGGFSRQGLWRFLRFMESLAEEKDLPTGAAVGAGQDAVTIRSIHKSKGLEYPVVLLPTIGKGFNFKSAQSDILLDAELGIALKAVDLPRLVNYPSLAYKVLQNRARQNLIAEELRILYVAMTRAREHLVMVGTLKNPQDLDSARELYAGHAGPIPAAVVLGAQSPLQWMLPVAIAAGEKHYQIQAHTPESMQSITQLYNLQQTRGEYESELFSLKPMAVDPPADSIADQVIARFNYQDPYAKSTLVPAATSATHMAHSQEAPPKPASAEDAASVVTGTAIAAAERSDVYEASANLSTSGSAPPAAAAPSPFLADLPEAPFVLGAQSLSATERGTATHLFLENLDFAARCDAEGLQQQLTRMLNRHLISPAQALAVHIDQVQWFLGTPLGILLQENAYHLHRELPFYLPIQPSEAGHDPAADGQGLDRIMLRGRIDVAMTLPAGLQVVDYKTDRISMNRLPERLATYQVQLSLYQRALTAITQQPVTAIHLVFLHLHHIHTVTMPPS